MKQYVGVLIIALVIIAGLIGFFVWRAPTPPNGEAVYCTQDAMLCPDGSYVSRVPPDCNFAACPKDTDPGETLELRINETGTALGVRITPLEVIEDSRCPIDVICIWAGQVTVRARLESGLGTAIQLFTTDIPITTEAETITLSGVLPVKQSASDIAPADYIFSFRVNKRVFDDDGSKG